MYLPAAATMHRNVLNILFVHNFKETTDYADFHKLIKLTSYEILLFIGMVDQVVFRG